MISSSGPRVNNFLGRSAERRYHKAETNEEAADQIPHQSPSETSRETVQPAAGASGELVPVRLGFDARSCCSQSGRVKMLLFTGSSWSFSPPQLYSDNVRA
jgi:hypothetical protein